MRGERGDDVKNDTLGEKGFVKFIEPMVDEDGPTWSERRLNDL